MKHGTYKLSKRPDEKIIFSFVKEFLDGNKIGESAFFGKIENT